MKKLNLLIPLIIFNWTVLLGQVGKDSLVCYTTKELTYIAENIVLLNECESHLELRNAEILYLNNIVFSKDSIIENQVEIIENKDEVIKYKDEIVIIKDKQIEQRDQNIKVLDRKRKINLGAAVGFAATTIYLWIKK